MQKLNKIEDKVDTSIAGYDGSFSVTRSFEVGVAEGLCFNYLDEDQAGRVSRLSAAPLSLDFIVYINYRYVKNARTVNLVPDRYIVRFSMLPSSIRVFQLSGMRRTEPEILVATIAESINREGRLDGFDGDIITIEDLQELQIN